MTEKNIIIYIHGYNSSGSSEKYDFLKKYYDGIFRILLNDDLSISISLIQDIIDKNSMNRITIMGTSLGGYIANYLATINNIPCILVNPLVDPDDLLTIAPKFNVDFLKQLKQLRYNKTIDCGRLVILGAADEVLDYKKSIDEFTLCEFYVVTEENHRFNNLILAEKRIKVFAESVL